MDTVKDLRHARIALDQAAGAIPVAGFGTLIADPVAARTAIRTALQVGFRHLDCAEVYRNEDIVGQVIQEAFVAEALTREELFVTSKLWNSNHRPARVKPAFEASLQRLQLQYLDCYLVHTPFAFRPGDDYHPRNQQGQPIYDPGVTLAETWQAMEQLVDEGRCRAIGLSDITLDKLKEIVAVARIKPAVVEVECHPYLPEWELLEFCQQQGIVLLSFAPLGHGIQPRITDEPVILEIADRVRQSAAQVALAWAAQRGSAFLTASTNPAHIRENFEISPLPDDAMLAMRTQITTQLRLNAVVTTGVPGFISRRD